MLTTAIFILQSINKRRDMAVCVCEREESNAVGDSGDSCFVKRIHRLDTNCPTFFSIHADVFMHDMHALYVFRSGTYLFA